MSDLTKFAFKISLTKGKSRGIESPELILDAICEDWGELQSELGKFGGDDLQQLKEHFNGLIDDQSSLGDALHGDLDDFKLILSELGDVQKKILTDELIRVEIFDPDN